MKLLAKARAARIQAVQKDEAIKLATPPGASPDIPRARMVRAPLSAAQLSRFMRPAAYGTQPLDSTELMNSPNGQEAVMLGDDPMDITLLASEITGDVPQNSTAMDTSSATSSQHNFGSYNNTAPSDVLRKQSTAPQIPISSTFYPSNQVTANGNGINNTTPPGFSPFDSNAEIDWQNWDQLVRQFGLEENGGTLDPTAGQPVDWAGGWGNGNMGSGGWF